MTTIDILIFIGVILFVVLGIRDGFFKKIFGILGFIGGLICATKFMAALGDIFMEVLGTSKEVSIIFAFFIIFIFVVVMVNVFYRWFGSSRSDAIKPISRISGGILGAIQGVVAISLILVMLSFFGIPSEEEKFDSLIYDETVQIAPIVYDYTTRWMPDSKQFFEELGRNIENAKRP
jgi:uncharacterized membrane protein required for colicin V production